MRARKEEDLQGQLEAARTRIRELEKMLGAGADDPGSVRELFALEQHSPVASVLLDRDRRVRRINRAGKEFVGEGPAKLIGLRAGRVFHCVNAVSSPRGCGYGEACQNCVVRKTVIDTFETGEAHWQEEATIPLSIDGARQKVHVLVSTALLEVESEAYVAAWLEDVTALRQARDQLAELARKDSLTGLPNRRRIDEELDRTVAETTRYGGVLSVAMMDIDGFKSVNDSRGHEAGDRLLQTLADLLRSITREADLSGRYGGDEFVIIMPRTDLEGATDMAERVKKAFLDASECGDLPHTSLSAGIAEIRNCDTTRDLLKRADDALYDAKGQGGNRVIACEDTHAGEKAAE